jgi:redox-sensitive bicupin YhaK (pirin superfamily)
LPMARQATRCVVRARQGAVLDVGDLIECQAGEQDTKFLLLAARPLYEPVVQHGPFVMNTEAQIREAIRDYREGRLALGSAESVKLRESG